jgi:GT2 family glycosyltransferase
LHYTENYQLKFKKGISVIIPNYNGRLLLPIILPALYEALENTKLLYEVIVSDDCSQDDTVSYLQNNFKDIKLITSSTNAGFSITINKGIFASQYDLLLLLNSDVILTKDYFDHLLHYFDEPDTFGVMGRIIGWDDDVVQDGGKYPSFHGAKIKTSGNYIPLQTAKEDTFLSMYLSGANAFVSTEKIQELGGFNELFSPFYVEDFELSLRAWRLGWKCFYAPHSICRHKVSTTIKSKISKTEIRKIYYRNKMFLHSIHLNGIKRVLWYLQLFPETLIHLVTGRLWYFSSLQMFFKAIKKINKARIEFKLMMNKKNSSITVQEVVNKILFSLKDKNIKRF